MSVYEATMRCTGFADLGNNRQEITLTSTQGPSVTVVLTASNTQVDVTHDQLYSIRIEDMPMAMNQDDPPGRAA